MAIQKILLAYNFSSLDQKAIEFAASAFAHIEGANITIFHAFTPVPDIQTEASLVTGKLKGSLNYLSQQVMQREMTSSWSTENLSTMVLRPTESIQFSGPAKRILPVKLLTSPERPNLMLSF